MIKNGEAILCSGMEPEIGFCVGSGFSREEIKDLLLKKGAALSRWSVFGAQDLCLTLVHLQNPDFKMISAFQAQLVLETLLKEDRILQHIPLIAELLDHKDIYKKIMDSFDSSRMSWAHEEEKKVLLEKTNTEEKQAALRAELVVLCQVYEEWILRRSLLDGPLLYSQAIDVLSQVSHEEVQNIFPKKIILFELQVQEAKEVFFWELLARFAEIEKRSLLDFNFEPALLKEKVTFKVWHTLEDAACGFVERLKKEYSLQKNWDDFLLLIPDDPNVRRTLGRVLEQEGVPLTEDRDPTYVKLSEELKKVLLPMELVLSGFSYEKSVSYLRELSLQASQKKIILDQFFEKGFGGGFSFFLENVDSDSTGVLKSFIQIQEQWPRRLTFQELQEVFYASSFFQYLSFHGFQIYEKIFQEIKEALECSEVLVEPRALADWSEKIKFLLKRHAPIVAPLRPSAGLSLYRMSQMSMQWLQGEDQQRQEGKKIFLFTLPRGYFSEPETKSIFWTEWEREVLSGEFNIRGPRILKKEREQVLKSWMHSCESFEIYDAHFNMDGGERPSLLGEFNSMGLCFQENEIEDCGVSEKWKSHFEYHHDFVSSQVHLKKEKIEKPSITASYLDEYSRCAYRALVRSLWKLEDLRHPQLDLYPEVQGNILHKCAELILKEGVIDKADLPGVITRAFNEVRLKGTIQKEFLIKSLQKKMIPVLEKFLIQEREYQVRSMAQVYELESKDLLEFRGKNGTIRGRADRVDRYQNGFLLIDYKTSSDLPSAREMLDHQYRLQLPFYAVAFSKKMAQEVYGVQFVSLTRSGGRGRGIFFKEFNGKEEGRLTHLRSNSHSLVELQPRDLWLSFEEILEKTLEQIGQGFYSAQPRFEEECAKCFAHDLCGQSRGFEKKKWNF